MYLHKKKKIQIHKLKIKWLEPEKTKGIVNLGSLTRKTRWLKPHIIEEHADEHIGQVTDFSAMS